MFTWHGYKPLVDITRMLKELMFEGQHCDCQLPHPQYLPVIVIHLFMNSKFRTSGMNDDVSMFSVLLQSMALCQYSMFCCS